jgi:hypothetical protein
VLFFISLCFFLYSVYYSVHSAPKSGSVVSEQSTLHLFFFVHVLDKILVQEVGTQTNRSVAISVTPSPITNHGGRK